MNILELAKRNQQKAWEIIEDTVLFGYGRGLVPK